jgi:RimJ/RimL family protein N-acetyltransferase
MTTPAPTVRLAFRELTDADLPALAAILRDPVAMKAYERAFTDEEVRGWLENQRRRYAHDGHGLWAVVRRDTGDVIGDCGLTWQDVSNDRVLEVGYHFLRAQWHRGFAAEAALACRDHAFTSLGAPAVHAIVRDTNLASMNVAIRCGMTARHRFVKHYRGVDMPHIDFAVYRDPPMRSSHQTAVSRGRAYVLEEI